MRMVVVALATVAGAACATVAPVHVNSAADAPPQDQPMPTPLDGLGTDVADAFSGNNLLYYTGAIAVTGVMVASDADYSIHDALPNPGSTSTWNDAANLAGYVVPGAVPPGIWIAGLVLHDQRLAGAGSAAIQALAVTMATTGVLKLAVGRAFPVHEEAIDSPARAQDFHPFDNGFGAWPGGHASAAFSVAAAFTAYEPEQHWIPTLAYPVAVALSLGMVDRDSHWASDTIAGALIGQAIGYSIGRNYRKRVRGEHDRGFAVELVPLHGADGLALGGRW